MVNSGFGGTAGGNLTINNTLPVRYDGVIQGSLNVVKNGPGTFVLGGANGYQGQTIVNAGTLMYGINNAIPSGSSVIVNANGTLDVYGTNSQIGRGTGAAGSINGIGGGASLQINNGLITNTATSGLLLLFADTYVTGTLGRIEGLLQFGNNWTEQMFVNNANDVLTINAAINSQTAGNTTAIISKMGAGKVVLNSGESQYAGSIIVNQGTMQLNGATGSLINCIGLQMNAGGTFLIDNAVGGSGLSHLNDQMAMTFNGGTFTMQAPAGTVRNELVGTINFNGGNSKITLTSNGTTPSILTANNFNRLNGATFTLDRSNASNVTGDDGGHLFFATPSPLTDGGAVPFGLVTNTTSTMLNASGFPGVTNVQAIYTTAQGVIEGTPVGATIYLSNKFGATGNWNSASSWTVPVGTSVLGYPTGLAGERVQINGNDTITLTQNESIDQVEFVNNSLTTAASSGVVTGGFNLTINSGAASMNQVLVSGTGSPTISTTGLVVNNSFLINNLSTATPGLTISSVISNGATTADLPLVWYKFDEGTLGTRVTGNVGGSTVTTAVNSGSLGSSADGIIYAGNPVLASTITTSTETAGNVATITTSAAHNLVIGQQVTIAGNSVAAYLGTFFIATVPSSTTFTFNNPTPNTTAGAGGTVTATSGAPSYVAGTVGTGALSFNGGIVTGGNVNGVQSAGFIDAPGFRLSAGSAVTVSFWFQIPNAFSAAGRPQFNFGVGASQATNGQALNRFSGHTPWTDGNTYFDYGGQANFQDRVQITGNINNLYSTPNTWIHCVMIAGGSTSPYRAIFMNGQCYGYHYFGSAGPQVTLERLIVGCSPESLGFNMFQGLMDDFRIYNRVLGPGEIATLAAKADPISASITKSGPGTLVLSGTNTFTAPLNIDAGVVSVALPANLNSASATPPQIGLNGGTLLATANLTTPLAQAYAINAPSLSTGVDAAAGVTFNIKGPMSGGSMVVNKDVLSTGTVFINSNTFVGAGTVSIPAASPTVTGVGTSFTTDVRVGDIFASGGFITNVVSIASNTSLTLGNNLGAQAVTAGNSYMICRPVARTGQTLVNNGTLRVPTIPVPQSQNGVTGNLNNAVYGSTIGSSQAFVNSGATLDIFTNTITGTGTITCAQNATAVTAGTTTTTFGTDVQVGDTIALLDNNGNPATAVVTAIASATSLTIAVAFNNTAPVTNRPFQFTKGPAGYFFGSPIFLNDGSTLLGTGNQTIANLGSGGGAGITSIVTVAQGASVTVKTRDTGASAPASPIAFADILRMNTAGDQLRGGGGLATITGTGTVSSAAAPSLTVTGTGTTFTTQAKLGDLLVANGQSRMIININSDTSVNVATPFSPAVTGASFTLLRTSSIVYGGAGRVQYPQDNGSFLYLGNHIINSSAVNNITLTTPISGLPETGGATGLSTPTISSFILMYGANNMFSAQQNTVVMNNGTITSNGGSLNCPLILNGGGYAGNSGNNPAYNASINIASDSYYLHNCFNSLNGSNLQNVGPVSGNGKMTLYAPVGATGQAIIYFQNPNNTYTGTVVANNPWTAPALQPANPDSPATVALPCTFQLGYTPQLYVRSEAPTRYSASVQMITGTAATQTAIATCSQLTVNNVTVTVVTNVPHNLTNNAGFVIIAGNSNPAFNGTYQITSVANTTTFTYSQPSLTNLVAGTGGTVTLASCRIDTGSLGLNNPLTEYLNNLTIGSNQTLYLQRNNNQGIGFYGTTTLTGPVNLATPTFYNNNVATAFIPSPIELAGPVVDGNAGYGFMKYGLGMMILSNGLNTYGGDTVIVQGTLQTGAFNAIPNGIGKGNLVLGGTFLNAPSNGTLDINSFSTNLNGVSGAGTIDTSTSYGSTPATPTVLTIGNADATGTIFAGTIQNTVGSIKLVKTGTGLMTISGNSPYTGKSEVNQGVLRFGGQMGTAVVNVAGGATLQAFAVAGLAGSYYNVAPNSANFVDLTTLNAHFATLTPFLTQSSSAIGVNFDFGAGGANFPPPYNANGVGGGGNFEVVWRGKILIPSTGTYSFGTFSDDGSMVFIDGATVVNNNFFQGVTLRTGSVSLTAGFHDIVIAYYQGGGGYGMQAEYLPGATAPTQGQFLPNNILFSGDLTVPSLTGSGTLDVTITNANIGSDNTTNAVFTGAITGAGGYGITKLGTGTQTLSGTASYNGTTAINSGTLKCGAANVLPSGLATGDVNITSPGILDLNGNDQTINGLLGTGTVDNLGGGTVTLTEGSGNSSTFYTGVIKNTTGTINLAKVGTGTLQIGGNVANSYSGTTLISGGTLKLSSAPSAPVAGAAWQLDASDSSTVTGNTNGASVSQWNDKSGNAKHVSEATAGKQPTYQFAQQNGLNVIRFDGVDDQLFRNGNVNVQTIFIVNKLQATQASTSGIVGSSANGANNVDLGVRLLGAATTWSSPGNGNDFTNPAGSEFRVDGVLTTAQGSTGFHIVTAIRGGSTSGFDSVGMYFPARAISADIGEIVAYSSALNATDRASVEAYLNAKWFGIGSTLPNLLPVGTAVTISSGATFDLSGALQTVASLTANDGAITNKVILGSGTLTVGNATSTTFDGVVSGTGNVVKQGTGKLTLIGANTFTGTTAVNAGELLIAATTGSTVSSTTVNNGALLTVNGTASVVTANGSSLATPAISGSRIRGTGTTATAMATDATRGNGVIWPGLATVSSGPAGINLTANETLTASSANFSAGGKLAVVLRSTGGPFSQKVLTTLTTQPSVINGLSEVGNVVTVQTSAAHRLAVGTSITITGASPTGYNSLTTWTVNSIINPSQFTYINTVTGLAAGSTGTVTPITKPVTIASGTNALTGATLSFAVESLNNTNAYTVLDTGTADLGISSAFGIVQGPPGSVYGTDYDVVYRDTINSIDYVSPTLGTALTTPVNQVLIVAKSSSVTPVKITHFDVKSEGAGVTVAWTAVSEYKNAGFNIYRRMVDSAAWTRVNPMLIAGRITNADEKAYRFYDWAPAGTYYYKLESVSLTGDCEAFIPSSHAISLDWNVDLAEALTISDSTLMAMGTTYDMSAAAKKVETVAAMFETLNAEAKATTMSAKTEGGSKSLAPATKVARNAVSVREVAARSTDVAAATTSATLAAPSSAGIMGIRWFSNGAVGGSTTFSAAKVRYSTPGLMLIPQASMPAGYDLKRVSVQREGRKLTPLATTDAGLLVYGPGYKDDYTNMDVLFVRRTGAATVAGTPTTATGLFASSMPVNVTSPASVTAEYHDVYFDYNLRPYTFAPWFSSKYLTSGSAQDFTLNLPNASTGAANLTVNVWSLTSTEGVAQDHNLQVLINGQAVGQTTWSGGNKMLQLSFTVPSGVITSGNNVVSLVTPAINGVDSQIAFLHSMTASYTRLLDGSQPFEITNSGNAEVMYELNHVPAAGAWVVDARFSDRATLVGTETQVQNDGSLLLRFMAPAGGTGKFVVTPVGQENKPVSIDTRLVKPLKLAGTYLATGPSQFAAGVQPLLVKRSREGIRGAFVDQEQLFDYYNYGRFGPAGIRNAVASARPSYLLLVGRTTYDYLNYEGANVDPLCPAFLITTNFWAQTTSDSAFGDLGRGYPEVAVGRLPVTNMTELAGAISRIVNYRGPQASGVRLHAVADQADPNTADFGAQLDATVKASQPDLTWQENYKGRTYQTSPEVTAAMKTAANGGADWLMYSGHGNAARLGAVDPRILDVAGVQEWTGNTVFLQATCTANWMAKNVNDYKSIAIQALTQPQGGISASIGTSTYMNSDVATMFMSQLLKNAGSPTARWGTALLRTQQWAGSQKGNAFYGDIMKTEQLFGDPAMPIYSPGHAPSTSGTPQPGATTVAPATGTF
ncbi:MAG: C25 family cysteine peptidase [Planctomycetota bacterium]